jgi:tripartite-type tricarboxylate transporter receptor subunit TctC
MKASRRQILSVGCAAILGGATNAFAQEPWPNGPVTLVVPTAPGGPPDSAARILGQQLSVKWGQPVVIVNRTGASGSIGALQVAKAAPDGYTLLLMNNVVNGAYELLNPKVVGYKSDRDFSYIGVIGVAPPILVVNSQIPAKNANEFIQLVRSRPGALKFSSAAIGAASHLTFELLQHLYELKMLHVPYGAAAPAVMAVASGEVDAFIGSASTLLPHIRSGRLRPLAVVSAARVSVLPELPTMTEAGFPGAEWDTWLALGAPAKAPEAIVSKISGDLRAILASPGTAKALQDIGIYPKPGTSAELAQTVKQELERTTKALRAAKISVD